MQPERPAPTDAEFDALADALIRALLAVYARRQAVMHVQPAPAERAA